MLRLLLETEIALAVVVIGAAIILTAGMLAGHRAHRWLYYFAPPIGRNLPSDTGAWLGLLTAGLLLAA